MLCHVTIVIKSYENFIILNFFIELKKTFFFFWTNIGCKLLTVDKKMIIMITGKKVIIMLSSRVIELL